MSKYSKNGYHIFSDDFNDIIPDIWNVSIDIAVEKYKNGDYFNPKGIINRINYLFEAPSVGVTFSYSYPYDQSRYRKDNLTCSFRSDKLFDDKYDGKIQLLGRDECKQLVKAMKVQCPFAGVKLTVLDVPDRIIISFPLESIESIVRKQKEDAENLKVILKTKRHDVVKKIAELIAQKSDEILRYDEQLYINCEGLWGPNPNDDEFDTTILSFSTLGLKSLTSDSNTFVLAEAVLDHLLKMGKDDFELRVYKDGKGWKNTYLVCFKKKRIDPPRPVLSDW